MVVAGDDVEVGQRNPVHRPLAGFQFQHFCLLVGLDFGRNLDSGIPDLTNGRVRLESRTQQFPEFIPFGLGRKRDGS